MLEVGGEKQQCSFVWGLADLLLQERVMGEAVSCTLVFLQSRNNGCDQKLIKAIHWPSCCTRSFVKKSSVTILVRCMIQSEQSQGWVWFLKDSSSFFHTGWNDTCNLKQNSGSLWAPVLLCWRPLPGSLESLSLPGAKHEYYIES